MPSKIKILIVSYLFPPVGGIGVQRALSLAKYLPKCGYEVHVLKATNAGGPVMDPDLASQIPQNVTVHQARSLEIPFAIRQKLWRRLTGDRKSDDSAAAKNGSSLKSWLKSWLAGKARRTLCPEPEILWVPFAVRKATALMRRHHFDVILVTVPPFSALVAGSRLKKRFPSLALVSDFRDEWLTFYLRDFEFQGGDYTRRKAEQIEREVVEYSDLVAATNLSSRDEIRRRYPAESAEKFVVAPNGYDPEVFANFKARHHGSPRMVVTHIGTVYKTASPRAYLDALDRLPDEMRSQIETRFVGRISESERDFLDSRKSSVRIMGFMPQAQALEVMEETDYLLLNMSNEISVPGKLFEYMASGKPILTITPQGSEADKILRETGAGICANPGEPDVIRAMLMRAFEKWRSGHSLGGGDIAAVQRYERPRLVSEYAGMIREVVQRRNSACERKPDLAHASHEGLG